MAKVRDRDTGATVDVRIKIISISGGQTVDDVSTKDYAAQGPADDYYALAYQMTGYVDTLYNGIPCPGFACDH